VAWIPLSEIRELLDRGQVDDGASITALLYLLAFAPIGTATKPGQTVPEAGASKRPPLGISPMPPPTTEAWPHRTSCGGNLDPAW
jgi:hypothetical protein